MFGVKLEEPLSEQSLPPGKPASKAPQAGEKKLFFGVEVEDPSPVTSNKLFGEFSQPFAMSSMATMTTKSAPTSYVKLGMGLLLGALVAYGAVNHANLSAARAETESIRQQLAQSKASAEELSGKLTVDEAKIKALDSEKAKLTEQLQAKTKELETAKKAKSRSKSGKKHHARVARR